MSEVETVEEHCQHKDCVYRCRLTYDCDFCNYAVMEGRLRGCPISQCDKYNNTKKRVTMTAAGLWYKWLLEEEEC